MHYKNGREAKNGDKVILLSAYGSPVIGILYDATATSSKSPVKPADKPPEVPPGG
jgi:hypothetical protein